MVWSPMLWDGQFGTARDAGAGGRMDLAGPGKEGTIEHENLLWGVADGDVRGVVG
jgi:hypothetical protein